MKSERVARLLGAAAIAALGLVTAAAIWGAISENQLCGYACFRMSGPAPYRDAPYFSREFVHESTKYPQPHFSDPGRLTTDDFNGRWLHSSGGHRSTAFQARDDAKRPSIYFLGGSTLESLEVPDEWTIPSLVQRELGKSARAENYGYQGASIIHQLEKLPDLEIRPGDTVVFYDGVNDLISMLLAKRPIHEMDDGSYEAAFFGAFGNGTRTLLEGLSLARRGLLHIDFFRDRLGDDPGFVIQGLVPPHLRSEEKLKELREALESTLEATLQKADRFVRSKGANFVHVFQPYLGSDPNLSPYEKDLIGRRAIVPLAVQVALTQGTEIYRGAQLGLERAGVRSYRLDHALAGRPAGQEVYFDICHLNHIGNEIISKNLVQLLNVKRQPTARGGSSRERPGSS